MEQKKVQRIIGTLVVLVLVIAVIPLFLGNEHFPIQESANIKAPPFKDRPQAPELNTDTQTPVIASTADSAKPVTQQAPVPPAANPQPEPTAVNAKLPEPPVLAGQIDKDKPAPETTTPPATASTTTTDPAPAVGSIIYEPPTPETDAVAKENNSTPTPPPPVVTKPIETVAPVETKKENVVPIVKKVKPIVVKKPVMVRQAKVKTQSPAWVVQMGNFAVKKNATHLTSLLRAAGYKAFAREVKSTSGKTYTRVYIGPELKQASAVHLSSEINHKLNLQGFVIFYKPLEA